MRLICHLVLCLVTAGCLVGCQSRPTHFSALDAAPLWNDEGNARSLAMDTEALRVATLRLPAEGVEPWYLGRRDVGPSVISGTISPRFEQSITITRDSQRSIGGRVFDRFNETTFRRTIRESSR